MMMIAINVESGLIMATTYCGSSDESGSVLLMSYPQVFVDNYGNSLFLRYFNQNVQIYRLAPFSWLGETFGRVHI